MVIPLNNIKPGDTVQIVFLANEDLMAGRLRDLGFDSGSTISCVLQKPKKNIAAYLVRNAVIALRKEDSQLIFVRPLSDSTVSPVESPAIPDAATTAPTPEVRP